jgi:peptide/nickel transport system permease protein
MTRHVVRRLVLLPVLLFVFSVAVFAIIQAPPADFLTAYAATLASSGSSITRFAASTGSTSRCPCSTSG